MSYTLGTILFFILAKGIELLIQKFPFIILNLGVKYTIKGGKAAIYNLFVLLLIALFFIFYLFIINLIIKLIKKLESFIKKNISKLASKIIIYLIAIFWIYSNITGAGSLINNLNYGVFFRYLITIIILLINLLFVLTNYKYEYLK